MIHNVKCHCGAVELEVNNDLDIIKQSTKRNIGFSYNFVIVICS